MFPIPFLLTYRDRSQVDELLRDLPLDGAFREFLADLLNESATIQKRTLERYDWRDPRFVENSPAYLQWTMDAAQRMPRYIASFAEEILNTVKLWSTTGHASEDLIRLYAKDGDLVLGVTEGARFSVQQYLRLDKPEDTVDVQDQARFIETLQHERVHVFRRYWGLLARDVPTATALGLVTAQEKLAAFGQPEYEGWTAAKDAFPDSGPFASAHRDAGRFLAAVDGLLERYMGQDETSESYRDGATLAVAAAEALQGYGEARLFVELLAHGMPVGNAFDAARSGQDVSLGQGRFVPGLETFRLRSAGLWTRGAGTFGVCARECVFRGSMAAIRRGLRAAGLGESVAHLVGLRGADQSEAQGFQMLSSPEKGFVYESLPHATYSARPLVLDEEVEVVALARGIQDGQDAMRRHMEACARVGVSPTDPHALPRHPQLLSSAIEGQRGAAEVQAHADAVLRICERLRRRS